MHRISISDPDLGVAFVCQSSFWKPEIGIVIAIGTVGTGGQVPSSLKSSSVPEIKE